MRKFNLSFIPVDEYDSRISGDPAMRLILHFSYRVYPLLLSYQRNHAVINTSLIARGDTSASLNYFTHSGVVFFQFLICKKHTSS